MSVLLSKIVSFLLFPFAFVAVFVLCMLSLALDKYEEDRRKKRRR